LLGERLEVPVITMVPSYSQTSQSWKAENERGMMSLLPLQN